jgi:hypothetical protein
MVAAITGIPCDVPVPIPSIALYFFTKIGLIIFHETYLTNFVSY